jgi:hypothetical protein
MKIIMLVILLVSVGVGACSPEQKKEEKKTEEKKTTSTEKNVIMKYNVSLDWINLSKFATGFTGDKNPDLFIRTAVKAEGILGVQKAIFSKPGVWPSGWEDVPGGNKVGITGKDKKNAIIYHDFGCQKASVKYFVVTVNLADIDTELPAGLKNFLETSATGFGGILGSQGGINTGAIGAEMQKMGQFPQIRGKIKIDETTVLKSSEEENRQFEATLTTEAIKLKDECSPEALAKFRSGK